MSHTTPSWPKPWSTFFFLVIYRTAVFSFEGIGLIIPITDAMREPHKFPKVLTGVMIFLTGTHTEFLCDLWYWCDIQGYLLVLFGGAGALGYLTFGSDIKTVVLVNLDTKSKMVQSVSTWSSQLINRFRPLWNIFHRFSSYMHWPSFCPSRCNFSLQSVFSRTAYSLEVARATPRLNGWRTSSGLLWSCSVRLSVRTVLRTWTSLSPLWVALLGTCSFIS